MNRQVPKYEWGEGVYTLLSWFEKEKVKNARVLVAGCGALGNEVVKNLALFGVGHIVVVDYDRIELSNLTRSVLFRETDAVAHAYKAEVVARRAREINPQIEVTPIVGRLESEVPFGIYRRMDVIIGCLDSRLARYMLNRMAIRAGKTWIDGGIENLAGNIRVFTPGVNCYECSLSREEYNHIMLRTGCADVVRMQEQAGRVATTPVSASVIAAIQVQEALKIIHTPDAVPTTSLAVSQQQPDAASRPAAFPQQSDAPFKTLQGRMLHYDGMTNSMAIYKYSSWKKNCPAHETWNNIVKGKGLSAKMTVAEALKALKRILGVKKVQINMRNNKFIDKIITDNPEKVYVAMVPESKEEDFVRRNEELRKRRYRTVLHKNTFEDIDDSFPYQSLTLEQIGIPPFDVIEVETARRLMHIELSDDGILFGL